MVGATSAPASPKPLQLALLLHGKLGSWFASSSEIAGAQRAGGTPALLSSTTAIRAFAAFTHASFDRHVVQPAARSGASLRVVIHSWSPEVGPTLDALYRPAASAHEPALAELKKVASQHLSMRRAHDLLSKLAGPPAALVMVARLDLLLFRDVPLAAMAVPAGGATTTSSSPERPQLTPSSMAGGVLYLPHMCLPSWLRLPRALADAEAQVLKRTCSGEAAWRRQVGIATGRRMLPAQLSHWPQSGVFPAKIPVAEDFTLFVLDYFFVGTADVATSFARLDLRDLSARLRRRLGSRAFPHWAHLYWAEHVTRTLVPSGVTLRFALIHEVDFTLGRFWRHGADCVAAVVPPLTAASPIAGGTNGVWARFANVSALAAELRGSAGDAALASSALTQQCPSRFTSGERVLCPWFSKACAAQQPATLSMAESAGRFAASAQLPPRQLLRAERCLTLTCLTYNGTARKRRRGEQPDPHHPRQPHHRTGVEGVSAPLSRRPLRHTAGTGQPTR
jgi:hypothetical protein